PKPPGAILRGLPASHLTQVTFPALLTVSGCATKERPDATNGSGYLGTHCIRRVKRSPAALSVPSRMQYNRRGTPRIGGNSMASTPQLDADISRIGHEIYEAKLRPKVETDENIGKLISIDIQ